MKQATKLGLGALALGVCVTAQAAAPVITNIAMVPRLTIASDVGVTNQLQCNEDLSQTNWTVLTNLLVTQSPYWFVDASVLPATNRFYRVVALLPPGMVLIPAGAFVMGNCMNPSEGTGDELPLHTNTPSAFYMDTNLVSKA